MIPVAAIAGMALLQSSCTKDFKEFNTKPTEVTDSMLKLDYAGLGIFITQEVTNVLGNATPGDASAYQVQQNLNADLYSGYMGTPTPFNGGQNNSNYFMIGGWNNAAFNIGFTSVMPAWLEVRRRAAATNPDMYAVASIIKVEAMHRVTDIYGPLPYSLFGGGGVTVPYDRQDSIYHSFFRELDTAVTALTAYVQAHPGQKPLQKWDYVYGGDYTKWLKFANSLRLRLAMRISYADQALAKQQAEAAVNNPGGLLTDNSDNAAVKSSNGIMITNPLYVISDSYGDIRMGANMESFLTGYNDPRLQAYFNPSVQFPGQYKGIRNGIQIVSKPDRQGFSTLNFQQSSPVHWMSAAEVYFLRAEGALRGWAMNGTPQSLYEKGIAVSFDEHAAGNATNYINDATSKAAPYTDPVNSANNVAAGAPELSTITIKWDDAASFETKLERIITQKWISMYPDGQEAWSEFRRTGYPKIFPVVVNNSGGTVDTKIQIRRLPFPLSEYQNNTNEVNKAVALLGGGKDNPGTRLWWDQKK